MKWTIPADLKAEVQRLWDNGEILRAAVSNDPLFPRKMRFRGPTSGEIATSFDDVRRWAASIGGMRHFRTEWREFHHRVFGANELPSTVWMDTWEGAVALLGKQAEAAVFQRVLETTRERWPGLVAWMAKRPLQVLDLAEAWVRLLDVVDWMAAHPRPDIYVRQVDIEGVDSKFIEAHRGVLSEWLDCVLPVENVNGGATGVRQFERRFGFRAKPERVRFRVLDPQARLLMGMEVDDLTVDAAAFARWDPDVSRVFMTENEINFLAFPRVERALVIFGGGYGFEALAGVKWLENRRIYYWGDLDTHGFAILDQLRSRFPGVTSILMDKETLLTFESHWGEEVTPTVKDLPRLTAEEREVYDLLRDNRIRRNLRLEQERIGFGWVEERLAALG